VGGKNDWVEERAQRVPADWPFGFSPDNGIRGPEFGGMTLPQKVGILPIKNDHEWRVRLLRMATTSIRLTREKTSLSSQSKYKDIEDHGIMSNASSLV